MTRYYFHTRTGHEFRRDVEGIEMPTLDAAMAQATEDAYSMIAGCIQQRRDIRPRYIEYCDAMGSERGTVDVHQLVIDLLVR